MRFTGYLQHVERALDVPYPERRELLAELADHLESLYAELRDEGLEAREAEERAIRTLALDETFIGSMDSVHAPLVRRALARLPPPVSVVVEHWGIGLLALAVLVFVISREDAMIRFIADGGLFMIPLGLMGLVILLLAGERIFSLFIKRDHSAGNLERRWLSLRFLGQASALTGIIGTLMGYFQAFSAADRISAKFGGVFPIWEVSRIALSTTIVGLTLALMTVVLLYVLRAKASRIEGMRLSSAA